MKKKIKNFIKKLFKPWLLLDIETSSYEAKMYGKMHDPHVVEITKEAYITGFAVKWYGMKKVWVYDLKDFNGSEVSLLCKILWWTDQCEYFIAHNGDNFDLKFINARLDKFNLPTLSPLKTVDTLKIARKLWNLPSYKLDFLGWYFNLGRKLRRPHIDHGKEMTVRQRSQEKAYNGNDVVILEGLFDIELPHIGHLPMFKISKPKKMISQDRTCPYCKEGHTQSRGIRRLADGTRYGQFQCQGCYLWFYVELVASSEVTR